MSSPRATKTRVDFADLVRPDYRLPVEIRFGVLQWMVRSAAPYRRYGHSGPNELLSCKPTCVNFHEIEPVESLSDLDRRFRYVLLSRYRAGAARWLADQRVEIGVRRWIYFSHRPPWNLRNPWRGARSWAAAGWSPDNVGLGRSEDYVSHLAAALLGASGKLRVQLNAYHADADNVFGVRCHVRPTKFCFILRYGVDYSVWEHVLAETRDGEAWIDTLDRACVEADRVAVWPEARAGVTSAEAAEAALEELGDD